MTSNLNSVDHLVFRVSDMARTERFYNLILGAPLKTEDYVMYMAGVTRLFFTAAESQRGDYDKEKVGLNHIALGVHTVEDLKSIQNRLDMGGISHSGIMGWHDGPSQYIWLNDPDGMRVEFWLRF